MIDPCDAPGHMWGGALVVALHEEPASLRLRTMVDVYKLLT